LVSKPQTKEPVGKPRRKWKDNIKMCTIKIGFKGRDWIELSQGQMAGFCEKKE
jgi:hypothetical protein